MGVRDLMRVLPPKPLDKRPDWSPLRAPVERHFQGVPRGRMPGWFVAWLDEQLRGLGWTGRDDDGELAASLVYVLQDILAEIPPERLQQLCGQTRPALPAGR